MNWGGFPVGFRFPVSDFSLETKKRCWSFVLPSLSYSDLTDSTLQEAESTETYDPDKLIYIAIVSPKSITPSRKNSLLWRSDGHLMSALSLYQPIVQENYLELFTNPKTIAEITPERHIVPVEHCKDLFPEHIDERKKKPFSSRALIIPKREIPYAERDNLCRRTMAELYDADNRLYLRILPLSPGGEGAVYTAASFQNGRIFTEMIPDSQGKTHRCMFGVLPGRRLLIDGFSIPDISASLNQEYGLGRAIQTAKNKGFENINICAKGLNIPKCEAEPIYDLNEIYSLNRYLKLYDKVITTETVVNGQIKTEEINFGEEDKTCASLIL